MNTPALRERIVAHIAFGIVVSSCMGLATFDHPFPAIAAGFPLGACVSWLLGRFEGAIAIAEFRPKAVPDLPVAADERQNALVA